MQRKQLMPVRAMPEGLPAESGLVYDQYNPDWEDESSLVDYWRVLLKFKQLILICTIGAGLLATLIAFLLTPKYTASSKIRIGTYEPVLTAASVEGVFQEQSKEASYLETQIREISSITMADRVLSNPKIASVFNQVKSKGFFASFFSSSDKNGAQLQEAAFSEGLGASQYRNPNAAINSYLGSLSVSPVRRTSLVEIFFTSTNPEIAALVANQHAVEYRNWVRESRVEQRSTTLQFLREQAEELRLKVAGLERELADYSEQHSIVAVNNDENITAQRMAQLNQLLTNVTAKRIEAEKIYEQSSDALSTNASIYDDETTQRMRSELASLEGEFGLLSEKFTPEYPRLRQLSAQIASLKQGIREQRTNIISGLKSKSEAFLQEEERLLEELEQQKSRTFELAKHQVQYNVLKRDLDSSRELLQNVLRQSKESALAIEGNSSNVSIVDFAFVPEKPSFPRRFLLIFGGFGFGLAVGLGLAFLLNHLDNTVRTPDVLDRLTALPSLGVVPSFELVAIPEKLRTSGSVNNSNISSTKENDYVVDSDSLADKEGSVVESEVEDGSNKANLPIAFINAPKSLAAEAYRTIRTAILLSQAGEPPRSILVTSAQSGEGKTTSAINIAVSLASSGGKVLIVDCDLRRPSIKRYLGVKTSGSGLVEVLTGGVPLEDVIINDVAPKVSILPSGRVPPNPAELIGSEEMKKLIVKLTEQFDFVVFDSPPVLPVTDSVILSKLVDGVVFVVKGGRTPKRVVLDAKERLESVGATFLGTVLNDIDLNSADYYYYNRYYSSYYFEEADEDNRPAAVGL
jgi:succinoglycan biosynthesis transport protein ExoP